MKIKSLRIRNFKVFKDETIHFEDFCTLIGKNNAGKSTILKAIRMIIDQDSPSIDEWNDASAESVIFEIAFANITDHERQTPGIAGLVFNNEIQIRYTATKDQADKISRAYLAYSIEEIIDGFSTTYSQCNQTIKDIATSIGVDGQKWRTVSHRERVKQEIRSTRPELITHGEPGWSDDSISIDAALKQGLPSIIYIPALKDPQEETKKTQKKNLFSDLISNRILPSLIDATEYANVNSGLDSFKEKFNAANYPSVSSANESINQIMRDFLELNVKLNLGKFDLDDFISKSATIRFDDGISTTIDNQGHGAQRAYLYSLTRMSGELNANPDRSFILLYEEPELFVHPHLLRNLRNSLKQLSHKENWQIVCTTHSPFLIDIADNPKSMAIIRRNSASSSTIHQIEDDPFVGDQSAERDQLRATLDFHPSVCEAFFADNVILVEGDTEIAVISQLLGLDEINGIDLSRMKRNSYVSCGGKWTIIPIARLLKLFDCNVKAIHDLDKKGRTPSELLNLPGFHPYNANKKISEIIGAGNICISVDTFENLIFDIGEEFEEKNKPYQAWKKIQSLISDGTIAARQELLEFIRFASA